MLASIATALALPLWMVIGLRGVQGFFVASCAVGARAIVADCFDGAERSKASNWMTIAWATGPILSPALGGYLQAWFGWTASFWFLAGWGALIVLVALAATNSKRTGRKCLPMATNTSGSARAALIQNRGRMSTYSTWTLDGVVSAVS